jgi:hypothetical protein
MGFDSKAFQSAKLEDRTAEVRVPGLADFFEDGDKPVFTVKGLTGKELALCLEAPRKNKNLEAVTKAMAGSSDKDKIEAFRKVLGLDAGVPDEFAKRLEMLVHGSVEPKLDHELAKRLAETSATDFYSLTAKISELTDMGKQVAKKKPTGQTPGSRQPSAFATSEADSCTK